MAGLDTYMDVSSAAVSEPAEMSVFAELSRAPSGTACGPMDTGLGGNSACELRASHGRAKIFG
jgi:hypothetical protein